MIEKENLYDGPTASVWSDFTVSVSVSPTTLPASLNSPDNTSFGTAESVDPAFASVPAEVLLVTPVFNPVIVTADESPLCAKSMLVAIVTVMVFDAPATGVLWAIDAVNVGTTTSVGTLPFATPLNSVLSIDIAAAEIVAGPEPAILIAPEVLC